MKTIDINPPLGVFPFALKSQRLLREPIKIGETEEKGVIKDIIIQGTTHCIIDIICESGKEIQSGQRLLYNKIVYEVINTKNHRASKGNFSYMPQQPTWMQAECKFVYAIY